MRLWLYLSLLVNTIVVLTFAGFGAYIAQERVQNLNQEIQRDTNRFAKNLATVVSSYVELESYDRVEEILSAHLGDGGVRELVVSNRLGKILAHVRVDAQGKNEVVTPVKPFDFDRRARMWETAHTLNVVMPVGLQSREPFLELGWLVIRVNIDRIEEVRRDIWIHTLWAIVLSIVLTTLLLALVVGRLSRAIRKTADFAENLIAGTGVQPDVSSMVIELREINLALSHAARTLDTQFMALRDSETRKAAVLESSLDCLLTMDCEGRVVDINPAAVATFGWTREEAIGANLAELILPEQHRGAHHAGLRRYLSDGVGPVLRQRIEVTALRRNREEFPVELTIVPFSSGDSEYFLWSLRDISEKRRLDLERQSVFSMLQKAADDLASRQFALDQHAIVSITDSQGSIVYVNDLFVEISQYAREELLGKNHRILRSGVHTPDFFEKLWLTISAGLVWHGEICNLTKYGDPYWVSATIVPMKDTDGLSTQYIAIRTDITEIKRVEQQLDMTAKSLGNLVDRYRQSQEEVQKVRARELGIGHQIQRSMLFGALPSRFGHITLAAFTEPSKGIDGDFFDFIAYGDKQFDVSIGDVMGKGVSAALIGAAVKQGIYQVVAEQTAAYCLNKQAQPDPASILNGLHRRVAQQLIDLESFVTLAYLRLNLTENTVRYVDAGHNQFLLVNDDCVRQISGQNCPLGVLVDEVYEADEFTLQAGDLLFLYSDGFTEARSPDGQEFGLERLSNLVHKLHMARVPLVTMVQLIRANVHTFEGRTVPSDDRTCVVLRVEEPQPQGQAPKVIEIDLPWTMDSLALLRQTIENVAQISGMQDSQRDALVLAAYEAATNLIRHAETPGVDASVYVRINHAGEQVEVQFFYLGEPFVDLMPEPDFSGESEGGFGLYIIRSSVDEVLYDSPVPGVARVVLKKYKHANDAADAPDESV